MTKEQAMRLAMRERDYIARKIRGQWVVWSLASEHVVEFDQADIDALPAWCSAQ